MPVNQDDAAPRLSFGPSGGRPHGSVCSINFVPENNTLVGGYEDGSVLVFDLRMPGEPATAYERIHKDAGWFGLLVF